MAKNKAPELLNSGQYNEALGEWVARLEENACDAKVFDEIAKGKESIDSPKQVLEDLDWISSLYGVSAQGPFREEQASGPPGGLCLHPDGRLLVADETKHRVQFFSRDGEFLSAFGEKGDRPGQFRYPRRVAAASEGPIYVADTWNHRVQVFDRDGSFLGEFGKYGGEAGQFNEPHGIALSCGGWIYVLDRCNHRVQVFDREFHFIGSFGGRGTPWEEDMAYLFAAPVEKLSSPAFEFPTDIAVDEAGDLYITDCNNHRVQKFNPYGGRIMTWGTKGGAGGEFRYPQAVAVDERSNIFIADMNNRRVQRFTARGEFLYALAMPEGDPNSMEVPVALACREGKLYVGLGFSRKILAFGYQSSVPGDFEERRTRFKKGDSQGMDRVDLFSARDEALEDRGVPPAQSINRAIRLEEGAEALEEKIAQARKQWEKLIDAYIPAREKRALLILQGMEPDLEFDEDLYALEKKIAELEKLQKENLKNLRRLYEAGFQQRSLVLSRSTERTRPALMPFYAGLRERIKKLASLLSELLREREVILEELSDVYTVFMKHQNEKRVEFKKGVHRLDGGKLLVSQVCAALRLSLSALKDWVLFLKKHGGRSSEWEEIFQEIFLGETGWKLDEILATAGPDWRIYDSISSEIQVLATALRKAGIEPSRLQPSSVSELFENAGGTSRSALEPLLIPCFLGKTGAGGVSVGLRHFKGEEQAGEHRQTAVHTLLEFSRGARNLAAPLKSFIENEMILARNKVETETILYTGAASEEKAMFSQIDRLMLFNLQNQLNYDRAAKLFLSLRRDYQSLFSLLLYLKEYEPEKIPEVSTALRESIAVYKGLQAELQNLRKEKQEGYREADADLATGMSADLNLEERKALERKKRINDETGALLEYVQRGLAEITGLHQRLNECAEEMPARQGRGARRGLGPQPDLIIGGQGSLFGELSSPVAVAVNSKQEIFVSNVARSKISVFTPEGLPLREFGGYGSMPMSFIKPFSLAFDPEDNLYVAEASLVPGPSNRRVQKISPRGVPILTIGDGDDMEKPTHVLIDRSGRMWVTDFSRNQIHLLSPQGDFVRSIGREGAGAGEFKGPIGAVQMENGDIAVSEPGNRRIQVLDPEGGHKTFCSMEGREPGDIYKLAKGPGGALIASDFSRHCLYVFDGAYRLISMFGGFGRGPGEFNGPAGMIFDNSCLFVCDIFNHRLQRFHGEQVIPRF